MTLGDKLVKLRKENNYTQEQLAEILGVSRQAISRWESNLAYPETEKLIRLGRLYHCSMDYLLMDEVESQQVPAAVTQIDLRAIGYERVSEKLVGDLPLWHINIGYGRVARGVFALGLTARGIVSVGLFSLGVVSVGVFGIGLLAFGAWAMGLVAVGAISVGLLAAGAVALGVFSLGACAIGEFAVGAAAIGKYSALGDNARAQVAIGFSEAKGTLFQVVGALSARDNAIIRETLDASVPGYLGIFKRLFLLFVH